MRFLFVRTFIISSLIARGGSVTLDDLRRMLEDVSRRVFVTGWWREVREELETLRVMGVVDIEGDVVRLNESRLHPIMRRVAKRVAEQLWGTG